MATVSGDPSIAERYAAIRKQFKEQSSDNKVSEPIPFETIIDEFEAEYSNDDLEHDIDGDIRYKLVKRIEDQAKLFEFRYQTSQYRNAAQKEWNNRHSDRPILEWSHKDSGYHTNGPRGVIYNQAPPIRTLDDKYIFIVFDKATAEDVTEKIFASYARESKLWDKCMDADNAVLERLWVEQGSALFHDWLERKRKAGGSKKHYRTDGSFEHFCKLSNEFDRETGYANAIRHGLANGDIPYTDAEISRKASAQEQYDIAKHEYEQLREVYGISDDIFRYIERQFPYYTKYDCSILL